MSGFGTFAPLPLRLGGSPTEGLTAEQHARICADLVAVRNTAPVFVCNFTKSGATFTINWYAGADSSSAADPAFSFSNGGTGVSTLTFGLNWENEYERPEPFMFRGADASYQAATAGGAAARVTAANVVEVRTFDGTSTPVDGTATVVVYGRASYPRIGDYDGALDKTNNTVEEIPYAWTWYQEIEGMLGSAFTREMSGHVHARKLALARMFAGVSRSAESIPLNAMPGTADAMLAEWLDALNVHSHPDDDRQTLRQRAAAKFKSARGNSKTDVDETVSELLGDFFVGLHRQQDEDLSAPPTITYWPGVNDGPASYDIGGGAWISERCHLVVEVTKPAGMPDADWLRLMNVDLYRELDVLLPAWATFNWATGVSDGFNLDIDDLDFTGITPS